MTRPDKVYLGRLAELSAQLVQTVKVKSGVLFSLGGGQRESKVIYLADIAATKRTVGLFLKLDPYVPLQRNTCIDYGDEMQISFVFCISLKTGAASESNKKVSSTYQGLC